MTARRESPVRETVELSDRNVLEIVLPGGRYSLRFAEVAGIAPPRELRTVAAAPDAVLGLADWRGSILTVLDLARLLEEGRVGDRPWLIRLAPPLDHVALATSALPTLGHGGGAAPVDAASLVERAGGGAGRPHGA